MLYKMAIIVCILSAFVSELFAQEEIKGRIYPYGDQLIFKEAGKRNQFYIILDSQAIQQALPHMDLERDYLIIGQIFEENSQKYILPQSIQEGGKKRNIASSEKKKKSKSIKPRHTSKVYVTSKKSEPRKNKTKKIASKNKIKRTISESRKNKTKKIASKPAKKRKKYSSYATYTSDKFGRFSLILPPSQQQTLAPLRIQIPDNHTPQLPRYTKDNR